MTPVEVADLVEQGNWPAVRDAQVWGKNEFTSKVRKILRDRDYRRRQRPVELSNVDIVLGKYLNR